MAFRNSPNLVAKIRHKLRILRAWYRGEGSGDFARAGPSYGHPLRDRRELVRPILFTSRWYYGWCTWLWLGVLLSFAIDIGVCASLRQASAADGGFHAYSGLFLVLAAFFSRRYWQSFDRLIFHEYVPNHNFSSLNLIAIGLGVGAAFIKFAASLELKSVFALVVFMLIFVKFSISFIRGLKDGRRNYKDRISLVEALNLRVSAIALLPLLLARAGGLVALIGFMAGTTLWRDSVIVLALAFFTVVSSRPNEEQFIAPCPRCVMPTSRVLRLFGRCPNCSPDAFM